MSAAGLEIRAGGRAGRAQTAAIVAAVQQLLAEDAAGADDGMPPAYRSAWRRAGRREAVERAGTAEHPTLRTVS